MADTAINSQSLASARPCRDFKKGATALDVLAGIDLQEKVALITGANCGIGYETARALALHNAHVVLACRNVEAGEVAKQQILAEKANAMVDVLKLDNSKLSSVAECVGEFLSRGWPLHILVLNAGVFNPATRRTDDGFETSFQVNHLAHFHLTTLLLDKLIASAPARVVVVASDLHYSSRVTLENLSSPDFFRRTDFWFYGMTAYANSKLCNVLFARQLDRKFREKGVRAFSVHPGLIFTKMVQNNNGIITRFFLNILRQGVQPEQGAATSVYCATAPELYLPKDQAKSAESAVVPAGANNYYTFCALKVPHSLVESVDAQEKLWDLCTSMLETAPVKD